MIAEAKISTTANTQNFIGIDLYFHAPLWVQCLAFPHFTAKSPNK